MYIYLTIYILATISIEDNPGIEWPSLCWWCR